MESFLVGLGRSLMPVFKPGTTLTVTVAGSNAASGAITVNTSVEDLIHGVVRLVSTTDCHIEIGTNPTATATSMFLPANSPEYFLIRSGEKVAVIQDAAGGTLYITPAL